MKTHLSASVSAYKDTKNAVAQTVLSNTVNSDQIKSTSWDEFMLANTAGEEIQGQVHYAKEWKDKPAKMLQWIKEDEAIRIEIWHQKKGEDWKFQHEHNVTMDDIKAFEPVYNYHVDVMKSLNKEFSNTALSGTSFLVRD